MSEVSPAPHSAIFLRSAHRALAAQSLDGTMNFIALIVAAFASFAAAQAQVINHNLVRPFPQPKPVTVSEKAAVRFKPQLKIDDGCHPYPAVQKDGSISGGLKWGGPQDGECTGSKFGSQVYARSGWVNDVWAIIYAWYFPKGRGAVPAADPSTVRTPAQLGVRHRLDRQPRPGERDDPRHLHVRECRLL